MSESRNELLAWYNDLSQSSYTKVEQFGSGAAHCLVMDSIFRDVALSKVKFQAKHEWEFVANFKVLQTTFDKHKIDNAIPVERLIKCKFQDNLEFLQWIKKFWDQYYPGGTYDPKVRIAAASPMKKTASQMKLGASTTGLKETGAANIVGKVKKPQAAAAAGPNHARDLVDEYQKVAADLTSQVSELKITVDQVEKEREFYFGKLREIEVFIQSRIDQGNLENASLESNFKQIQEIMYKTEEGFEAPDAVVEV